MNGNRDKKHSKLLGLDTNVFIYHYHNNPEFISHTEHLFYALAQEKYKAITSIITVVELLSLKTSEKEIKKLQDAFVSTPHLTVLSVELEIALKAAEIRRMYDFRISDALQLATALYAKADGFITNDQRLQKFKEIEIILINELKV